MPIVNRKGLLNINNCEMEVLQHAQVIWDYMLMKHSLVHSDIILVLGNNDVRVAEHAAYLWTSGYGKNIIFSGNLGNLTRGRWKRPEYEVFRQVAINMGVPESNIMVEREATNTGENIRFSKKLIEDANLNPQRMILVQTPYMERRTYATFLKQWFQNDHDFNLKIAVSSPPISLQEYPNSEVGSLREVISIMLGCLERIAVYPLRGFSITQEIPDNVWFSYTKLVSTGKFDDFLLSKA